MKGQKDENDASAVNQPCFEINNISSLSERHVDAVYCRLYQKNRAYKLSSISIIGKLINKIAQ